MFFLRCAFWLTIVYASMSWAPGALAPAGVGSSLVAAGRSQTEAMATSAAARATDFCTRHAPECIAVAARLASLRGGVGRDAGSTAPETVVTATAFPLPAPDPRRRSRDAKLAHAP